MDQIYLKGQYGSNHTNLSKTFRRVRKKLFTEPYRGNLREQYCSNLIVA